MPIRVLLVEDHSLVREAVRSLLTQLGRPRLKVVGEAGTGPEAIKQAARLRPDVVLMDITIPELGGIEATRAIRQTCPETEVVMLTVHADEQHLLEATEAGALGYVTKTDDPAELLRAVEAVHSGQPYRSAAVSAKTTDPVVNHCGSLTYRERQILRLVAEGHSSAEIANLLGISTRTVDTHRRNLMTKLDIHGVAALTRFAVEHGLVNKLPSVPPS